MIRSILILFVLLFSAGELAAQNYQEFVNKVTQAMRLDDTKRIDQAVRADTNSAIHHFKLVVALLMNNPGDETAAQQHDALLESWARVYESDTLERLEQWQQLLDSTGKSRNDKAGRAYDQSLVELQRIRTTAPGDRRALENLRDTLMQIAEVYESVGNNLAGADTQALLAQVYNLMPDKSVQDRREMVYHMERFKSLREAWGFTRDTTFAQNVAWMEAERERIKHDAAEAVRREAEGYGNVKGVETYLVPDADKVEQISEVTFKLLKKPVPDMSPQGGQVPLAWPAVTVDNAGPSVLPWFKGQELFMIRPASSRYGITANGGIKPGIDKDFSPIEVSNRIKKPSLFKFGPNQEHEYAAWFYIAGEQESYQGFAQNLAPLPERASVYYKCAGSWVGEVADTEIVFYDQNSNGLLFESDPFAQGLDDRHLGVGPDNLVKVPAYDGMKVGRDKVGPYSEWFKIEDQWYHLRVKAGGQSFGVRPANPEYLKTGTLQLDWSGQKGVKPEIFIVTGEGDFAAARFDLSSGKPVEVPAGNYTLGYGRLVSGKGARIMTAGIYAGNSEAVEVKPGENTVFEIGAPFTLDCTRNDIGAGFTGFDSVTMRVRGRSGELYARINGAAPAPLLMVSRHPDGKGAKEVAEFVPIRDGDTANEVAKKHPQLSSEVGFYSVVKGEKFQTMAEIKIPEGGSAGLHEEKNKLFGELLPVYR